MTWQDPGGNTPPGGPGGAGGPDDDATRADWDLAELDRLVGNAEGGPSRSEAAGPPPSEAPGTVPPAGPPAGPPPAPAYAPGLAWAPPPTHGPGTGPGAGLAFAGTGARFVAWLIDVLLLGLVGAGIALVAWVVVFGTVDWSAALGMPGTAVDGGLMGRMLIVTFIASALSAGIDLAYFVLLWTSAGRATIGMRIFGLQVGNAADGRTLARGQAARRWLAMGSWLSVAGAIPLIGGLVGLAQIGWYLVLLITTATDARRQGLHDRFAGTAIVQPAGRSNSGLVIGCIVLAVLVLVVLPIVSIVALIFLGSQVSDILSAVGESV